MFIGALSGASALWQLLKANGSQSDSSAPTSTSSSADTSSTSSANSTSETKLSTDLKGLLLDLQSATTSASSATSSTGGDSGVSQVANDLRNLVGDVRGGRHGHHHHDHSSSAPTGTGTSDSATASGTGASDPFQRLASALTAYAKQLTANAATSPSSTALTA